MYVCVSVCRKTLGQPTEPKNGWIWLKFGTLVPWINTWGSFFIKFKINFRPKLGQNLQGSLESPKMIGFGWNLLHLFLGWISGGIFSFFKNIHWLNVMSKWHVKPGVAETEIEPSVVNTRYYILKTLIIFRTSAMRNKKIWKTYTWRRNEYWWRWRTFSANNWWKRGCPEFMALVSFTKI